MGITKLMDFIKAKCPTIIQDRSPLHYKNKTLAIDSPSAIYKFLIKTITSSQSKINIPTDSHGNQTGHLIGIMYRALLCMQVGIRPIWVFDGKPPHQKLNELKRRKNLKQQAQVKVEEALEMDDIFQATKQTKRAVRISQQQVDDTIKMLNLMGMPAIKSFGEAEAQCAWLTTNNLAYGVISQDMDNLAFGAHFLIRDFARDKAAQQISIQQLLQNINLTQDQFIDFCILCGCDYTSKIAFIGPVKGYQFIQQQKNIQSLIKLIVNDIKMKKKHTIPDDFNYLRARQLFKNPNVNNTITKEDVEQKDVDEDGLRQFLKEKSFNQSRVQKWIQSARKFKQKNMSQNI